MSLYIRESTPFLKKLKNCCKDKHSRRSIISHCSDDNIKAVSEIALNTIKGNLKLRPKQFKELKKHRSTIRKLAKRSVSNKTKKQLLIQKGGFLPFLLTPFLSAIGGLAGRALAKSLGI